SDESVGLRKAWSDGSVILSPNPYEYLLLADKERLIDWSQPGFFKQFELSQSEQELLGSAVPKSYDLSRCDKNAIWDARKNLFFKPKREFGSKKAFKGASISRKTFEELCHKDCMAQEYIPAPIYQTKTANGLEEFKYDLRCYFYQDQLQSIVARVYQGQVTNLRTPGGGFAPVLFDTGSAGH
ncbi:MAG: hypothetical protein N2578_02945, partial [Bdellovibrionaceae bacterium]|nr:hypothetical protein [Pseudobdellovibrionaceae bacterium]